MDLNVISQLIKMVNSSSLSVLEVEDKDIRVRLENTGKTVSVKSESVVSVSEETVVLCEQEKESKIEYKYIKSPIVGTFHSMETIGNGELKQGDTITKGQAVCAVEAMKLMNTIESGFDGECVEIMANEGDMIEFGQPLIKLK